MSEALQAQGATAAPQVQSPVAATAATPAAATPAVDSSSTTGEADGKKLDASPETPEKPEDKRFASKFAALSKKEKAIVDKELKLKAKEKELETKFAPLQNFEKEFFENPTEVMARTLGKDWYQKLTNLVIQDGKKDANWEVAQLRSELAEQNKAKEKEREAALEAEKKKAEENLRVQQQSVMKTIGEVIKGGGERFELTQNHPEGAELVYNVIENHYLATAEAGQPKVLSYEEGAEAVEKYLEEEALKWAKLKKLQGKLTPQQEAAKMEGAPAPATTPKASSVNTLTNSLSTQAPTPNSTPALSIEESKRKAAQLLKWN